MAKMTPTPTVGLATPSTQPMREKEETEDVKMDREFFSFPYEPYDIQLQLMTQLYHTIDARHIGIFESPTGTGKSMSLICGALTWLLRNTDEFGLPLQPQKAEITDNARDVATEEPSWLASYADQALEREAKERRGKAQVALQGIEKIKQEPELQSKKRKMGFAYNYHERKRPRGQFDQRSRKQTSSDQTTGEDDDEKHIVASYDSGAENQGSDSDGSDDDTGRTEGTRWPGSAVDKPSFGVVKIIYCSRTHSQISQFVREIQKTAFNDRVRVVSLGSRKNLCINDTVTSLESDLRMADKCLDMLQGSKSKKEKKQAKCPFYERELLRHYKDYALAQVQDIEDLHKLGEEMSICSYYGTRESVPLAQVIAMPYSMLLSKDTRESLGIELKDNIVLLDEAHNIVEAINSTYQVLVSNKQLVVARRSLWAYFKKYEKRLKGKNCFYIKQLLSILEALTKYLRQKPKATGITESCVNHQYDEVPGAVMMSINDFVFNAKVDNFNMYKIVQYLHQSELPKKLLGFMDFERFQTGDPSASSASQQPGSEEDEFESRHVSPLRNIQSFFKALTNATQDGRLLVQNHNPSKNQEGQIKFLLLNPANHFQDIVYQARSIILAGGTMKPVSQVIDQLFSSVPKDRIDQFSCGHVIPPENLLGFSLSTGPSQKHLEFTFSNRSDQEALDELGRILLNLCRVVPHGIVVFFPSYRFEESVVKRWMETKQWDQIGLKKPIFREPKHADQLGSVLASYSAACTSSPGSGGMLLSVVGGKMSEGINFSDELARCVVMVGLPYPNARDPELAEKMAYLDKRHAGAGRALYNSLCMKAVNQSIGRSIRHQKDYSTIVLVDSRYGSPHIRSQLPGWIQDRVQAPTLSFGQVYSQMVQFFRAKQLK